MNYLLVQNLQLGTGAFITDHVYRVTVLIPASYFDSDHSDFSTNGNAAQKPSAFNISLKIILSDFENVVSHRYRYTSIICCSDSVIIRKVIFVADCYKNGDLLSSDKAVLWRNFFMN